MLRKSIAVIIYVLGGVLAAFVAMFLVVGWGEWHCGINDFNVGIGSVAAGSLLTAANLLWRSVQPIADRQKMRNSFIPLWIFGYILMFLVIGIPVCPFPSR
ncbi:MULTISPECIES: hypothetical protein [unclassified Novosphingobium]|uniref:hypothetical protein n=1 Tax=unclassified Novosphingobium TaxID=2644732 RepID=UPI001ACFC3CD|nr:MULTISPECIES: hypothetical protein [unclassified Novosphingobium]MBN9145355.1 hypothetical protein [Novosphingobium sp.]MDR6709735.1 putative transporter YbjL [Novosphingobium sp. 1748]